MVQLASALGLLSVGTLVVEMFMLYIAPQRKYYTRYKYEETADFSDVRDAEHAQNLPEEEQFKHQLNASLMSMRANSFDVAYSDHMRYQSTSNGNPPSTIRAKTAE